MNKLHIHQIKDGPTKSKIKPDLRIKRKFLTLIDGCSYMPEIPPLVKNINSFRIGITKLEVQDNTLIVHLRRPGLLIGKGGKTINKFEEELDMDIEIVETHLVSKEIKITEGYT